MDLATDPAEKRAVLALLPSYPCQESLEIAQRYLQDPNVATEAQAAANRLRAILNQR
jgi:hypothetical protein